MAINEFGFDTHSLLKIIKEEREKIDRFVRGRNLRLTQFLEYGVDFCKGLVPKYSMELENSISIRYTYERGLIKTGEIYIDGPAAEYAKFVEFGTGIKGVAPEHPKKGKWISNKSEKGEKGWVFPADNGKFYTTHGQPATAFMYKTYMMLKNFIDGQVTNKKWYSIRFTTENRFSPVIIITKKDLRWGA